MKIAIAWNYPSRLLDCSFRFEQYAAGFRELGHSPILVSTGAAAAGFPGELFLAESLEDFKSTTFWRALAADVVLIVTWHRMDEELRAIKAAGSRVLALTDTDGRAGSSLYWRFHLERQILYQKGGRARRRFFWSWLKQQARERLFRSFPEDRQALASTAASDAVVFGHEQGRQAFARLLRARNAEALIERLAVVPYTIGASFLSCPLPDAKEDLVVAIGRWADPQKNARLLAAGFERLLTRRPQTRIEVFGDGGSAVFADLARFPNFQYRGPQVQEIVATTLTRARTLVFSSRWEGCPHAALEMLACGGTLVGPNIASLISFTADGRFGATAKARTRALADALEHEMIAWDLGRRDLAAIARHWRAELAPESVCARLLASCDRAANSA